MKIHTYSLILTGISIIILSLILFLLIGKQNSKNQNSKPSVITNNIVSLPKLDIKSLNLTWNLIEKEKNYNTKLEEKKIIDTINSAWESWKKDFCNDIKNETNKIKCIDNSYAAKSSIDNNPDLCSKILDIDQKIRCLDNYYNENALKSKDYNLCKNILNSNLKNSCNYSIIISKIESPDFKQWIEICNILSWESKNYCQNKITTDIDGKILQNAINTLDLKSCDKINFIALKIKCKDIINFKLAISTKDLNKCIKISDSLLKSQCNETLIKIK